MKNSAAAKKQLIQLLQLAYSGELAAAMAYKGHWKSLTKSEEIKAIQDIEHDELTHRQRVGEILEELGVAPLHKKEILMRTIGHIISLLCHVTGWYFPMDGAGRLESKNVGEYEEAAELAYLAGYPHFADEFLEMAEVEWDHEKYFHNKAKNHWLYRFTPPWKTMPPRENIRKNYQSKKLL